MPRLTLPLLVLATVSATAVSSFAQQADPATPSPANYLQAQPAPIEHAWESQEAASPASPPAARPMRVRRFNAPAAPRITESQPAQGIYVRATAQAAMQTVAKDADRTELRLERGLVNVSVHHPASGSQILVDLPGGQTAILKDGFYTFNAETNTVRVLKGEAHAFPGNKLDSKPIKVKEDHAVAFTSPQVRATEFVPEQARTDVLPSGRREGGEYGTGPYSDRPHGEGFYDQPYGWGYPYYGSGWGYWGDPFWGYGYPGFGFGYYGGFRYGGGFRGRVR